MKQYRATLRWIDDGRFYDVSITENKTKRVKDRQLPNGEGCVLVADNEVHLLQKVSDYISDMEMAYTCDITYNAQLKAIDDMLSKEAAKYIHCEI